MMNEHDPEKLAGAVERRGEACELALAEPTGRQQGPRRQRRGQRDQRDAAAPAHEREVAGTGAIVAAHVVAPERRWAVQGSRHIDVVIAGNDGDVGRCPKRVEPGARSLVFIRQRQVDQIAGHGDVVNR